MPMASEIVPDTRPEPERAASAAESCRARAASPAHAAMEIASLLTVALGYIAGDDPKRKASALARADVYLEEIRALLGLARGGAR